MPHPARGSSPRDVASPPKDEDGENHTTSTRLLSLGFRGDRRNHDLSGEMEEGPSSIVLVVQSEERDPEREPRRHAQRVCGRILVPVRPQIDSISIACEWVILMRPRARDERERPKEETFRRRESNVLDPPSSLASRSGPLLHTPCT